MFVPGLSAEAVALGNVVLLKLPLPKATDQTPLPTKGAVACKPSVVPQSAVSAPALAGDGSGDMVTTTVSLVCGQVPVVTVQTRVFAPTLSPLTTLVGSLASAKLPVPEATVQLPLPGNALVACKLTRAPSQNDKSGPALATMAAESRITTT